MASESEGWFDALGLDDVGKTFTELVETAADGMEFMNLDALAEQQEREEAEEAALENEDDEEGARDANTDMPPSPVERTVEKPEGWDFDWDTPLKPKQKSTLAKFGVETRNDMDATSVHLAPSAEQDPEITSNKVNSDVDLMGKDTSSDAQPSNPAPAVTETSEVTKSAKKKRKKKKKSGGDLDFFGFESAVAESAVVAESTISSALAQVDLNDISEVINEITTTTKASETAPSEATDGEEGRKVHFEDDGRTPLKGLKDSEVIDRFTPAKDSNNNETSIQGATNTHDEDMGLSAGLSVILPQRIMTSMLGTSVNDKALISSFFDNDDDAEGNADIEGGKHIDPVLEGVKRNQQQGSYFGISAQTDKMQGILDAISSLAYGDDSEENSNSVENGHNNRQQDEYRVISQSPLSTETNSNTSTQAITFTIVKMLFTYTGKLLWWIWYVLASGTTLIVSQICKKGESNDTTMPTSPDMDYLKDLGVRCMKRSWTLTSSPIGLGTLTVLLLVYSFYKFSHDPDLTR